MMTTIGFTGDIAFSRYYKDAFLNKNLFSEEIIEFLNSSDYNVINLEGPLTSREDISGKDLVHASSPVSAEKLSQINANIWNVANNHIMDCGHEGLLDTLNAARDRNCQTIGAGRNRDQAMKPAVVNSSGGIGIFSVGYYENESYASEHNPGYFSWDDNKRIKENIRRIKSENRWCVMVVHGGEEFSYIPMPYIRKRYLKYLKYGADIIVAHHPHVVQNYEKVGEKTIFYSLGNFIFDTEYQRLQRYTEACMLLKISFEEDKYQWQYMPIKCNRREMTLSVADVPAIFTNIDSATYKKLWSLGVKTYLRNTRISDEYFKKLNESNMAKSGVVTIKTRIRRIIKLAKDRQILFRVNRKIILAVGNRIEAFRYYDSVDQVLIDYFKNNNENC